MRTRAEGSEGVSENKIERGLESEGDRVSICGGEADGHARGRLQ